MSFESIHNDYLDPDRHFDESPETPKNIEDLIKEYSSLHGFYRAIYKSTCGLTIGFYINGEWVYNSDLSNDSNFPNNNFVNGVSVSSIVEGSDAEVEGGKLIGSKWTVDQFWQCCDDTCEEVSILWQEANEEGYES